MGVNMPEAEAKIIGRGYAYDDVLIVPDYSDISSRSSPEEINTSTLVARGMPQIELPIISANMDTVTENRMAMAMALHGGLGVIHRFSSIEEQARQVKHVKDRMRMMEDHPPTIPENATISDARKLLQERERGYVIVHSGNEFNGAFIGMATLKDFASDKADTPIIKVMTSLARLITVQPGTTLEQAVEIMRKMKVEKIPVVDNSGHLIGVYTIKDYDYRQKYAQASIDSLGRLMVGAAIGVKNNDIERAHNLVDAGVDVLVLDIAHGHLAHTKKCFIV